MTSDSRTIRRYAELHQCLVDEVDTLGIGFVVDKDRKIHSHSSIDLSFNKSRRNNLATEIYDLIRHSKIIVEDFLRVNDDAAGRVDPEILVEKGTIDGEFAIRELDQHFSVFSSSTRSVSVIERASRQSDDAALMMLCYNAGSISWLHIIVTQFGTTRG